MVRSSENQGRMTPEEMRQAQKEARKARFQDMIMILEHNGFRVIAIPKAMEKENTQMIVILKARGYTITAPNEDKGELTIYNDNGPIATADVNTGEITELEGIDNGKTEEEENPASASEEKKPEGSTA